MTRLFTNINRRNMAAMIRSAKSGSEWTTHDLLAHHIRVDSQSLAQFFNIDELPPLTNGLQLFASTLIDDPRAVQDPAVFDLLLHLELVHSTVPMHGNENAVDMLGFHLLKMLGYGGVPPNLRLVTTRQAIPFRICGETRSAQTDVCVLTRASFFLLIQEDKRTTNPTDPEAQLIAEAIAAFQQNNELRDKAMLPALEKMTFPGITLRGSYPTFYKLGITKALDVAVRAGTYPEEEIVVSCFRPPDHLVDMVHLECRAPLLQYFQAFRNMHEGE